MFGSQKKNNLNYWGVHDRNESWKTAASSSSSYLNAEDSFGSAKLIKSTQTFLKSWSYTNTNCCQIDSVTQYTMNLWRNLATLNPFGAFILVGQIHLHNSVIIVFETTTSTFLYTKASKPRLPSANTLISWLALFTMGLKWANESAVWAGLNI